MIRVGVDVGGTFTDLVLEHFGAAGGQKVFTHKSQKTRLSITVGKSTPENL